ncbi:MAG: hypothetical protein NTW49_09520 [Bacteroidia bacterium]|nr:hypothetical protein [Bacteroidia bacterium]
MRILILLLCFIMSGCIITNTPGFYTGYNKLNEIDKDYIEFTSIDSNICNLSSKEKIYAITGTQLRECLRNNDTSLVYILAPNCNSKSCILVSACQDYCNNRNYKLYVVAQDYMIKKMKIQNNANFPMLTINHKYYKIDYVNNLVRHFKKDLFSKTNISREHQYDRFLFFKSDKLIKTQIDLFE